MSQSYWPRHLFIYKKSLESGEQGGWMGKPRGYTVGASISSCYSFGFSSSSWPWGTFEGWQPQVGSGCEWVLGVTLSKGATEKRRWIFECLLGVRVPSGYHVLEIEQLFLCFEKEDGLNRV